MAAAALDAQTQRDAGLRAEYTAGTLFRLSNVVRRLERRGWVHRAPDPADGRASLANLTERGWDKVFASEPAHVDEVQRPLFDPLTKTRQRRLGQIAERILKRSTQTGSLGARRR